MAAYGFVYVLRNECMPGIFKIGFTDRSPLQRCDELSNSSGVPCGFSIVAYGEADTARGAEQDIHSRWEEQRLNKSREFFRLSHSELIAACSDIRGLSINFVVCAGYHEEESKDLSRPAEG